MRAPIPEPGAGLVRSRRAGLAWQPVSSCFLLHSTEKEIKGRFKLL